VSQRARITQEQALESRGGSFYFWYDHWDEHTTNNYGLPGCASGRSFLVPFPGRGNGPPSGSVFSALAGALIYSLYVLPIGYLAELLFGIPAWKIFKHYGVRSWFAFVIGGAFIGWLVNLSMDTLVGSLASRPLTSPFNPLVDPYLSVCVVGASGAAALFRAIIFSGGQIEDSK